MRKTGIDFESFDREHMEARRFTNNLGDEVGAACKMLVKGMLLTAAYDMAKVVTYPVRLSQEWKEFKAFKRKCELEEQERFDTMRRTNHF